MTKLSEIEARAAKATFGPWGWWCNKRGEIYLATQRGGRVFVMTFNRHRMHSAQPCFQVAQRMVPATKIGPADHNGDVDLHAHPDAAFIAAARSDVPDLCATVRALAEQSETRRSAIEYLLHAFRLVLASKPCAFVDEAVSCAEAALATRPTLPVEVDE